jgi:hypothetical protein
MAARISRILRQAAAVFRPTTTPDTEAAPNGGFNGYADAWSSGGALMATEFDVAFRRLDQAPREPEAPQRFETPSRSSSFANLEASGENTTTGTQAMPFSFGEMPQTPPWELDTIACGQREGQTSRALRAFPLHRSPSGELFLGTHGDGQPFELSSPGIIW